MKLAQTPKLQAKGKSSLFFRKISLLVFLSVFAVVSSIDALKVSKDELTGEITFNKLQLVANAKPTSTTSSIKSHICRKVRSTKTCRRTKRPKGYIRPVSGSINPGPRGNGQQPPKK